MNVSLQIAKRYLFGKKSTNAINLITGIAILGIAVGTAALILILSVFNGFKLLTKNHLDHYNPDLKITPIEGKFFAVDDDALAKLENLSGILGVSRVIEEVAHFEYNSKQQIGIVKGVDDSFIEVTDLNEAINEGQPRLKSSEAYYAIVGSGVYRTLNINLSSRMESLKISVPNRRKRGPLDKDFKTRPFLTSAVFSIKNEKDNQYIIVDYTMASNLLDLKNQVSALEIKIDPSSDIESLKGQVQQIFPQDTFDTKDRMSQDAALIKIMNIEKWSSYLIFSFTLVLIIFNVIGCLWMIVLDKRKDLSVLQSFGATKKTIKRIFLIEGAMISGIGFFIGLVVSVVFYILQKNIGIITVPDGFSISSYPMEMHASDIFIILITVMTLGICASIPASRRAGRISGYVRME